MSKKRILWISPHLPYDNVDHASGKIQNYYMNKLIEASQYDIRLISFYKLDELKKFTMNRKIYCDLYCYYNHGMRKLLRNIVDLNYLKNPFHKFANRTTKFLEIHILSTLKEYKKNGYYPDIIVLQWTQIILFVDKIKKIFPSAKIVGIEEDVTLLSCQRMFENALSNTKKIFAKIRFKNIEREEIKALRCCNLIILNNEKDKKILQKYGFEKELRVWVPYFFDMTLRKRADNINHNILFYGSMSRPENYLSVQWLLDKVKPLLDTTDVRYIIIGGNPDSRLHKYQNDKVVITGFVDDIKPFFETSLCLAAPLVLGAGIKIKILEAMSAGMPVLTNNIGIEGIPAKDGEEFYFCLKPEDYAEKIRKLLSKEYNFKDIEYKSKAFINKNFNYTISTQEFMDWLQELLM